MVKFIMPFDISPEKKIAALTEIAICDSAGAMYTHKERFRFGQNAYINACEAAGVQSGGAGKLCNAFPVVTQIVDVCNALETIPVRIHLAMGWENILRIAAWKADFTSNWDIFILLKKAGIAEPCLVPFADAPISDLLPFLYYRREFDALRRVCIIAKRQVESRLKKGDVRVACHLMAEDPTEIVSTSL